MESGVIQTLLKWLRPWYPVSGLLFGYVFGVVWCLTLLIALDKSVSFQQIIMALCFAIFWAVLWGLSGLACQAFPGYGGTTATTLAIVCGHWYTLSEGVFDGWVFITIPFHATIAILPCHWVLMLIAVIRGRIE